jgi:integrase
MSERKTTLNDKTIDRLPFSEKGQYIVRDADLPGFFLVIGVRRKTFTVQAEFWKHGIRHTTRRALGTSAELTTRDARIMAKQVLARIASGEFAEEDIATKAANVTLGEAWDRYKIALERKDRSPATIAGYQDHVERVLKDWLKLPLRTLGENPRMVSDRHDKITRVSGPSAANGCMRTLRAVYNHARRSARMLPADNPTMAVDWNEEKRRDTAMGSFDLPAWMDEAGRLRHLIRREFHLFTLLSGSRPGALKRAELKHFDFARRVLHLPRPKGGAKRAFDIPLSREMIRCLVRAMRASRMLHPENAERWIFAADSEEGHLVEHKEDRAQLSKWGNDLRQTYRTLGQAAGLSEVNMHLLMNHKLSGVNEGYITRDKLMSDHLRHAQQALSTYIVEAAAKAPRGGAARERIWPRLPSRWMGDPSLDPTPPDPRLGVPLRPRKRNAIGEQAAPAEAA